MDWKIKSFDELTLSELYEILKSRYEVFTVGQKCLYQDCDDKDKEAYHLFLEEDNKVVAYLRILKKGVSYDEVSIGRVMVLGEYRKRGLAKEMMDIAISFIKETLKENEIKISAQEYLRGFYESLGFEKSSGTYLEVEIPHIKMIYKDKTKVD